MLKSMKPLALSLVLMLCFTANQGCASERASFQWPTESMYRGDVEVKQEISDLFYYSATTERLGTDEDDMKIRLAALSRFPADNASPGLGWTGQTIKQVRWMHAQLALVAIKVTNRQQRGVSMWECTLVLLKDANGNWDVHRNYRLYMGGAIE